MDEGSFARVRVVLQKQLVHQELDGEMVILDMQSGKYFGIDEVGCRIWQLVEQDTSLPAILQTLLTEYEVEEAECRRQVIDFLNDLERAGLIALSVGG